MINALCYYIVITLEVWISFLKHNVSSSILQLFLIHSHSPQGLTMLEIYTYIWLLNKYGMNTTTKKRVSSKQPMHNFSWLASDFHDFNQEKMTTDNRNLKSDIQVLPSLLCNFQMSLLSVFPLELPILLQHVFTHQGTPRNDSRETF